MPVRSTFQDHTLRSAWARLTHVWRPMAGWTLLVWAVVAAVLVPLSSGLLGRQLLRGDDAVVGNVDLLAWLLTPWGMVYGLTAGGLAITAAVVRYAGYFHILTDEMHGRRASLRRTALRLAPQLPLLFKLCVAAVLAAVVLAVPLLAGLGGSYALFLRDHDINFYLTFRPMEWHLALTTAAVWTAGWAVAAGAMLARAILVLPAYLDGHRPLHVAARRAWYRARGGAGRLLRLVVVGIAGWIALRVAVDAAFGAAASSGWQTIAAVAPGLRSLLLATGLFVAGSLLVDAVISFLGFAFLATLLTKFYYEDTDLHGEAPAARRLAEVPASVRSLARRWLRPRVVIPMLGLLLALGATGGGLLLDRLPEPRPVLIIAHRAGGPPSPENTLAALERSIAQGADYAEIDVQRTRDGVLVIVHDADLMRVAGDPRRIADADFAAIRGLAQRPDDGSPATERRIATLEEFLDRARGRIRLNIELKYYGRDPQLAPAVVQAVRDRRMEDDVVLMSLELEAVRQVRQIAPELELGYVSAVAVGDLTRLPVDFLAVAIPAATPRLIRAARDRSMQVHAWTANQPGRMAELMERGVDGIITDHPDVAVRVRDELAQLSAPARLLLRTRGLLLGP